MLRLSRLALGVGPYSLFMKEQKNNPALKGLSAPERGRATAKLYNELSTVERNELMKRARATPYGSKSKKKPSKPKPARTDGRRTPSRYAEFVKANIAKYAQLPQRERMTAVAKLWREQKHATQK
ncbi:hypothetical protein ERJ75_000042000 [Trypanosoma vivax]|nr:Kinetoplast-associated protein 4 [Trypanosoma vivax]KAH8620601.1 hypothetical protein ERJ75_000042000 [Trypanosoma vivax]